MSDTVISIENLSKAYRLGTVGGRTFREDTARWWAKKRGKPDPYLRIGQEAYANQEGELIWALRDINLDVHQGEILGIIGRNGAGKSTLLKILSRITAPTEGNIKIKGRIGSLLEVGTGFHPELTGRENVFLNGAILGMTRAEIASKFDEIVAFSGVEQYIDTPVKRYSSGMHVRLAFAVAAHLEPEILVIDEVLAVGDADFRQKSVGKMGEVAREGRTVLLVSHNMSTIASLCQRSVCFDLGRLVMDGHTDRVVNSYLSSNEADVGVVEWKDGLSRRGVNDFKLRSVKTCNEEHVVAGTFDARKPVIVDVEYEVYQTLNNSRLGIVVSTSDGVAVFTTYDTDFDSSRATRTPGVYVSRCRIPGDLLTLGRYTLTIEAYIPHQRFLAKAENCIAIDIAISELLGSSQIGERKGIVLPRVQWDTLTDSLDA